MSRLFLIALFILPFRLLIAVEGLWIPMLLEELNEAEMHELGMQINADDLYSTQKPGIKDAVVLFGRGCTASIVSDEGLLITNHHCGFGNIRRHSSTENDYMSNGFWAMNRDKELPNPGLTVTLLIDMQDVTELVLRGVEPTMTEWERQMVIHDNSTQITEKTTKEEPYDANIRSFFHGNQFYLLHTQTFRDVRLVGAPPVSIGKFGGDTDNWMWPRHTGDFSLFRIYADTNNQPAEFSPSNVPYKPAFHLPVSMSDIQEGDFTVVYGYPGRTNVYASSEAVKLITQTTNPNKIQLREARLEIFNKYMDADPKTRLQYASKDAGVANGWKKMIGENNGISRLDAVSVKKETENQFYNWAVSGDEARRDTYAGIPAAFEKAYHTIRPYELAVDYMNEGLLAIELLSFARRFQRLVELGELTDPSERRILFTIRDLQNFAENFYKDYHPAIDREVATQLIKLYLENQPAGIRPDFVNEIKKRHKGNVEAYVNMLFNTSMFANETKLMDFLETFSLDQIKYVKSDPALRAVNDIQNFFNTSIRDMRQQLTAAIDSLQRVYMAGLMEMRPQYRFYPDANFTLRASYGIVEGYSPADAVNYNFYTTLDGKIEKENPDVYDYRVNENLKQLYHDADYGEYADADGRMRVAFIASNHTTGGNSGSPVLNAQGHLAGINFDRCWQATMSDLIYDEAQGRNISVDIRYVLFIMDKFAGASHLIEEMTLVR